MNILRLLKAYPVTPKQWYNKKALHRSAKKTELQRAKVEQEGLQKSNPYCSSPAITTACLCKPSV
ncbi:hypothetical protein ULVI_00390 [Cochleicola gelatinilyticus]|uniref:Uncharacterized protein n=1 Tax=Cochleicola gelatinilyticus TaxID=1763537 RepID=A0A167KFB1_9FLAO|nr:hypothetical protein ULVI_00390 [Cochleicola gelatinilyticus]